MIYRAFRISRLLCAAVVTATVAAAIPSYAQEGGPGYISLRFVDVKPDAVSEFEAAIKDIGAALREAGVPFFHVYQRIRGGQGYTIVSVDGAYNGMPPVDLDSSLISRVTAASTGNTLVTAEIDPAIGIQGGSFEPEGDYMYVRVRTTSPANRQDYFEWQRDELVPALREAGLTDRRAGRIVAGGNINTFVEFTYSDEFRGGGVNLGESMGQRQAQQMLARGNALTASAEDYRYRFRRDLGYTALPPQ
jgi:hypothetical protein